MASESKRRRLWRNCGTGVCGRSWESPEKIHPTFKDWFHQQYHGGRYSFGYPACPNLEDQKQLFQLLDPGRIKVSLSEEFQLVPEQSTSAIVVHHPEAKYFNVA